MMLTARPPCMGMVHFGLSVPLISKGHCTGFIMEAAPAPVGPPRPAWLPRETQEPMPALLPRVRCVSNLRWHATALQHDWSPHRSRMTWSKRLAMLYPVPAVDLEKSLCIPFEMMDSISGSELEQILQPCAQLQATD